MAIERLGRVGLPLQGLLDFIGRKARFEFANELLKITSAPSYRRGERAIEFAVKKKLPVLGVETYDV